MGSPPTWDRVPPDLRWGTPLQVWTDTQTHVKTLPSLLHRTRAVKIPVVEKRTLHFLTFLRLYHQINILSIWRNLLTCSSHEQALHSPNIVLKCPPGLIGAESQIIGSPSDIDTDWALMVAKNVLSAEIDKFETQSQKLTDASLVEK